MDEALRLADALMDYYQCSDQDIDQAAAELRRLHAENERLSATVKAREDEILTHSEAFYEATRLLSEEREKNERLLEALKLAWPIIEAEKYKQDCSYGKNFVQTKADRARKAYEATRAAIKAVEGEDK